MNLLVGILRGVWDVGCGGVGRVGWTYWLVSCMVCRTLCGACGYMWYVVIYAIMRYEVDPSNCVVSGLLLSSTCIECG